MLRHDFTVQVEFNSVGTDEGGACFVASFAGQADAVRAIERFIGSGLATWTVADPVEVDLPPDWTADVKAQGVEDFKRDLRSSAVELPEGATFVLLDNYWKDVAEGRAR